MTRYILRRLAQMIVVLWIVATATFVMMRSIPGGPFDVEQEAPAAVQEAIAKRYKLNDPLWLQYLDYMKGLARFDLGPSYRHYGQSVNFIIKTKFPVSAKLGILSILLSLCIGLPLGVLSALRRNGAIDHAAMLAAIGLVSVPSFVLAYLLMLLFANPKIPYLYFLAASWQSPLPGETLSPWETVRTLIIPVLSLSSFSMAYIARLTRAGFIEVLAQDYMRTARAKGLGPIRVIFKHGLRNALMPVATYLGPLVAGVLTGSFVIEQIYGIPGLGREFVSSISNRDYTLTLGVTIFYCALLVFMNLVVDLIYPLLDPRVKIGAE